MAFKQTNKFKRFSIKHEWTLYLVALQFLTRVSVNLKSYQPDWLHQSSRHFAGVGLLVGVLCAGVYWLSNALLNADVAAVVTTVFGIKLTGAFHEDGLADTCDGLGGGVTRKQALTIMKDSRLGTYGTLGLVSVILLKISLLATLPLTTAIIALIIAHTASRLLCTSLIVLLPYGGEIEHAKAKPMAQRMTIKHWFTSSLWLLAAVFLLWMILPQAMSAISLWQWLITVSLAIWAIGYMYKLLKKRLGGYTGDGLGATQQLTEVLIYIGMAIQFPLTINL